MAYRDSELYDVVNMAPDEYRAKYPHRQPNAQKSKLQRMRAKGEDVLFMQGGADLAPAPTVTQIVGVTAGERLDVESAIERHRQQARATAATHQRKQGQHIYITHAPFGIGLVSDQHFGSPHCDIDRAFAEQDLILNTPGMYAGDSGDSVDGYIIGKLMGQNMHHTVTVPEEWEIARHYYKRWGDRLLWKHSGNHPQWHAKLVGTDYDRDITPDGVLYDTDEILLNLHVGPFSYLIRSRHKWGGSSIYNPTHGMERAARFDDASPDIFIGGHVHKGAMVRDFNLGGKRKSAILVGTYKGASDTYARQEGFNRSDGSTAAAIVFFPDGNWEGFSNLSAACQVMKAIYGNRVA